MIATTRLKRAVTMRSGGTPPVDDPAMWDDEGLPWASISDMSKSPSVTCTDRQVSALGIRTKALPVGEPGTLLFAMYASVGAVAVLGVRASWNQAILGIQPRQGMADSRFVRYWLEHLKPDLMAITRSNTQDNLNSEQVGNLSFPVTPLLMQRIIADYLDGETVRIEALIATKQRLVHVLNERFVEMLEARLHAVDGTKPSTVRRCLSQKITDGPHETPEFLDAGIPFISIEAVVDDRIAMENCRFISDVDHHQFSRKCSPQLGDVLLAKTGATIGKTAIVDVPDPFSIWSPLALLRPRPDEVVRKFVEV